MTDQRKIRKALNLKKLPPPINMRVLRLDGEDYTTWDGDPALRISVLLDESTEVEKVTGEEIGNFERAIRENLHNNGISLFPYIFYAKPSELAETDEE